MSEASLETRSVNIDILEILRRGPIEWNQWREEHLLVSIDLSNVQLSQAKLNSVNLNGVNLHRADLSGAQLNGANLSRACLHGANLSHTQLHQANLNCARLNGVNLSGADLSNADLCLAELRGVDLSNADLNRTKLHGADLNQSDLTKASLVQAKLNGTDLSQANLSSADLSRASFSNVDLSDAELRGTNLNKAYLNNVNFSGTKLGIINLVRYHVETFWKKLNVISAQGYQNFDISIFDAQIHPAILENLQSVVELFISSSGYEIVATIQSVNAACLKDIRYKVTPSLTPELDNTGIKAGIEGLQKENSTTNSQIGYLGIQPVQRMTQATANVLKAVENFDDIVLLLGQLVIVKYVDDQGKSHLFTKTIPLKLQRQLTSSSTLLGRPQDFINFLNHRVEVTDKSNDTQFVFAQEIRLGMV